MLDFSGEVIKALSCLNKVIDMREHKAELDMMVATNWKREMLRKGPRSHDVVKRNTATGLVS